MEEPIYEDETSVYYDEGGGEYGSVPAQPRGAAPVVLESSLAPDAVPIGFAPRMLPFVPAEITLGKLPFKSTNSEDGFARLVIEFQALSYGFFLPVPFCIPSNVTNK